MKPQALRTAPVSLSCYALLTLLLAWAPPPVAADPTPPQNLAWVGHSLVPIHTRDHLRTVLSSRDMSSSVRVQLTPGGSLRQNWNQPAGGVNDWHGTRNVKDEELPRGIYDGFMFTEAIPVASQHRWNDSRGYAVRWVSLARQHNPNASIFMFEGWPSWSWNDGVLWDSERDQPWVASIRQDDKQLWLDIKNHVAEETGVIPTVVPGGHAFARLFDSIESGEAPPELSWDDMWSDDIHFTGSWGGGNANGRHFMTALKLAYIYGIDPRGMEPRARDRRGTPYDLELTSDEVGRFLETLAWELALNPPYQESQDIAARPNPPTDLRASW